ncbi:Piso0_004372 [Millerozyma farinosa CBS 7064]|uniref:Piso0_004372 protein n=1 Tax=Pichia sorbitophila (strain ATCC MYA-4447 / BCRC 22081 / CBS 7064 / NBRC 10061 / NRRL Y-12695) TaxID=559304 RepID=G8Y5A4_PICSO|nr:Piso0_004372 [Millerozyma farinosa CBS 7064]CCE84815.1 Piso0_004372 [Millerozyma farinosa CBS 7064]
MPVVSSLLRTELRVDNLQVRQGRRRAVWQERQRAQGGGCLAPEAQALQQHPLPQLELAFAGPESLGVADVRNGEPADRVLRHDQGQGPHAQRPPARQRGALAACVAALRVRRLQRPHLAFDSYAVHSPPVLAHDVPISLENQVEGLVGVTGVTGVVAGPASIRRQRRWCLTTETFSFHSRIFYVHLNSLIDISHSGFPPTAGHIAPPANSRVSPLGRRLRRVPACVH